MFSLIIRFAPLNRNIILLIVNVLFDFSAYSQNWQKTFGGNDADIAYTVIQTHDKGFLLAGTKYYGTGTNFPGCSIYIIKTDSQGILLWEKTAGDSNYYYGLAIDTTPDNNFVIYTSNKSITKMNNSGDTIWQYTYNSVYPFQPTGNLVTTNDSNVIFCGSSGNNILIGKLNFDGDTIFTRIISPSSTGYGPNIKRLSNGEYSLGLGIISGELLIKLNQQLNVVWTSMFSGFWSNTGKVASPVKNGNNFIVAGIDDNTYKPVLIKTNSVGTEIWRKFYGFLEPDSLPNDYAVNSVSEAFNGDYLVTGRCTLGIHTYVYYLRTDTEGNLLCEKYLGSLQGYSNGNSINFTYDNGAIITGETSISSNITDADVILIKMDNSCGDLSVIRKIDSDDNTRIANAFIYPNPCSSFSMVTINGIKYQKPVAIKLHDISGEEIWHQVFSQTAIDHFFFRLPKLTSGLFFLRVSTKDKSDVIFKLLIK